VVLFIKACHQCGIDFSAFQKIGQQRRRNTAGLSAQTDGIVRCIAHEAFHTYAVQKIGSGKLCSIFGDAGAYFAT